MLKPETCSPKQLAHLGDAPPSTGCVLLPADPADVETNDLSLPGTDSQAASDLLSEMFPAQATGSVPIAFRAPDGARLSNSKYKKPIQQVTKAYGKDEEISQAVGPFSGQASDQLDKKHMIGYISLNLKDSPSQLSIEGARRIIDVAQPLERAGLSTSAGGYLGQKVSKPSTHVSEVVRLTAAVFILPFTFGTAIAMGIPISPRFLGLRRDLGSSPSSATPWRCRHRP